MTTFELEDIKSFGIRIALARMTRSGHRKARVPGSLVWMAYSKDLGAELTRGLQAAWFACWAVFHRDQLDAAELSVLVRPWREVVGPVPGLDFAL
jgi:hypothetical protein